MEGSTENDQFKEKSKKRAALWRAAREEAT